MLAVDWLEQLGFLLVALFTLGSALGVMLARRVLHAALWLLPTLIGVAAVFAMLGAHLLFAMQLIVYVGAITVLIVFAVMMLEDASTRDRLPKLLRYRIPLRYKPATDLVLHYSGGMQHVIGGVVAAGMMLAILVAGLAEAAWFRQWRALQPEPPGQFAGDNVRYIGELLLTTYLLPFEVASVVLLVALIGAVVLARRTPALRSGSGVGSGADGDGGLTPSPSPCGRGEHGNGRRGTSPRRTDDTATHDTATDDTATDDTATDDTATDDTATDDTATDDTATDDTATDGATRKAGGDGRT